MENFQNGQSGKMYQAPSQVIRETTSQKSSTKWLTSGHWQLNGTSWMHNGSESHNGEGESLSSLAGTLQPLTEVAEKYYLSPKTAGGILRRAERKGNSLPELLRVALQKLSGTDNQDTQSGQKEE